MEPKRKYNIESGNGVTEIAPRCKGIKDGKIKRKHKGLSAE